MESSAFFAALREFWALYTAVAIILPGLEVVTYLIISSPDAACSSIESPALGKQQQEL